MKIELLLKDIEEQRARVQDLVRQNAGLRARIAELKALRLAQDATSATSSEESKLAPFPRAFCS